MTPIALVFSITCWLASLVRRCASSGGRACVWRARCLGHAAGGLGDGGRLAGGAGFSFGGDVPRKSLVGFSSFSQISCWDFVVRIGHVGGHVGFLLGSCWVLAVFLWDSCGFLVGFLLGSCWPSTFPAKALVGFLLAPPPALKTL